ncbi:hypothetical protein [Brotaphodocola sp.]|uniref:hypothetical protein n=1 Tax=Brotaphodocola sp. TaxID=3073577 RepID=UPI003D7C866F
MDFVKKLLGPSIQERFQKEDEKRAKKDLIYSRMNDRDLLDTYQKVITNSKKGKGVSVASFYGLMEELQKRGLKNF